MPNVSGDIVNLINGVSQQAVALRQPTQAAAQTNFYATIVDGLKKRPPTEVLAKVLTSAPSSAKFHLINRDASERYIVVLLDGDLKVYDFDGNEKTVAFPDGKAYLSASVDPAADFTALSIADYTFIVNRRVTVALGAADKSPTRHPEAIVNVSAGNYGRTYQIRLNGDLVAEYATPDGGESNDAYNVATTFIANHLYNDLVTAGYNDGVHWGVGLHGNAIHILRWDDVDFNIAIADGQNGNGMTCAKGSTQKFANLPNYGPQDFVIEVGNSQGTKLDNYWVRADKGGNDQNSTVIWKETTKPGTVLSFDASTMPHILVRNSDGTFAFKRASWDKRKCGDGVDISPNPSFVGRQIQAVTFHRNRLGFLADESVVFSRSGSYFDFWRTTATTILDDDPIDVSTTHIKISLLKHAIPFQDYLLLFSEQTQFRLAGNELLTPKTVSMRPMTEYGCSARVAPIANGPSVFFVADGETNNGWAAVYEYAVDKNTETADADNVTAHCPSYIPAGVYCMTGSPEQSTLAFLTTGEPGTIYIYRYYWAMNEKLQSSWSRWTLAGGDIREAAFFENDLLLLIERNGSIFLEKIEMDPAAFDEGFGFKVALDQRVHSDDLPAPSYDPETDRTTYTLPYLVPAGVTMKAVVAPGGSGVVGAEATITSLGTGSQVVLRGDTRTRKLFFGHPYRSDYTFSPFFPRQPQSNGGTISRQDGRLQVLQQTVNYDKAAYFRVVVETDGRAPVSYPFAGIVLGEPQAKVGEIVTSSGRFTFPVLSRNDRVRVTIVNDTWLPSNFIAASWKGVWNPKSRQV